MEDSDSQWHVSMSDTSTCIGDHQTLLKLTSDDAPKDPVFLSSAVGAFSAVAVEKQLTLVFEQKVSCVVFGSIIDDFAQLEGGIAVIAERNGTVSLGAVAHEQFKVTQSYKLCQASPEGQTYAHIIFQAEPEDDEGVRRARLFAMTTDSTLIVGSNICIENNCIFVSKVAIQKMCTPPGKVSDMAATRDAVVAVGPDNMWVSNVTDEDELELESIVLSSDDFGDAKMIKVYMLPDVPVFITMDDKGQFYLWDHLTLTVVHTWSVPGARDFRPVVDQEGVFSLEKLQLLVLVGNQVKLINPALQATKAAFEVSSTVSSLTRCPALQDDILVTECQTEEDLIEVETSVSLRLYTEASPEKRLKRLLARHRFAEAEELAKLYGLHYDLDPSIIQSLMLEAKSTYQETWGLLDSCRQKLLKNRSGDPNVKVVLSELDDAQHRLTTYKLVFGEENFSAEEWSLFRFENPLKLCSMLIQRDPEKAFTLWRCLQEEIKSKVVAGTLAGLLLILPRDFPPQPVAEWLCGHVASVVCGTDPEAVESIVAYVNKQIESMERSERAGWIDEAICLTSTVLESLQSSCLTTVEDLQLLGPEVIKTKLSNMNCVQPLRALLSLLQNLKDLITTYNFSLPLHRLKQESKESLAFCMLSRVPAADMLPSALRSTVLPYISSRKLDTDEVLAKYVEHLIQQPEVLRRNSSRCGDMVKAIIDSIGSSKEKITAATNLVRHMPLPLPDFLPRLVQDIVGSTCHSNPLCKVLQEQWALKEASDIMYSVEINSADVKSPQDVLDVAKYVLACGKSFDLALKVLAAYNEKASEIDLYMFDCRLKVEHNQLDDLVERIKNLPKNVAHRCCYFVVGAGRYMDVERDSPQLAEAMLPKQLLYWEAAERVSPVWLAMTEDLLERMEIVDMMTSITRIKTLQLQYKMAVSEATLQDKTRCLTLFKQASVEYKGFEMLRLGKLLTLDESELFQALLSRLADEAGEKSFSSAEKMLRMTLEEFPGWKLPQCSVHQLLDTLAQQQPTDGGQLQYMDLLRAVTSHLVAYCPPEKFTKALELSNLIALARDTCSLDQPEPQTTTVLQRRKAILLDTDLLVEPHTPENSSSSSATPDDTLMNLTDLGSSLIQELPGGCTEDMDLQAITVMEAVRARGQNLLALRIFYFLKFASLNMQARASQDCHPILQSLDLDKKISAHLVKKLLESPNGSLKMALAFALNLDQEESVTLIKAFLKSCRTNYKQLKRGSAVACAYSEILGDETLIKSCDAVKVIAKWGTRLKKIGIPFSVADKLDALVKLVASRYCTVDILKEYYKDFSLESICFESYLGQYLENILSRDADLSAATAHQAREILRAMSDPLPLLLRLLSKTSPYAYLKLGFLLEEIKFFKGGSDVEKGLQLLRYLNKYTRRCPPSVEEKRKYFGSAVVDVVKASGICNKEENVAKDMSSLNILPEESQHRLPYHLIIGSDKMAVIKKEIALESLEAWLNMAPLLEIERSTVLLRAVINIMEDYTSSKSSSTPSSSSSSSSSSKSSTKSSSSSAASAATETHMSVSPEFLTLLANMKQVMPMFESEEHVLWCCNSMLDKLQNVEEKKLALKSCISYTQMWLESTAEVEDRASAEKALAMFRKRLVLLSTTVALVRAGLWEALGTTSALKGSPEDLIRTIYNLPTAQLQKAQDVNVAVDTIGSLHHVDTEQLRLSLIQEWLQSTCDRTMDLDQTMTFDITMCADRPEGVDTVVHIELLLRSSDGEACLERVAEIAEEPSLDPKSQLRARFCLLKAMTITNSTR